MTVSNGLSAFKINKDPNSNNNDDLLILNGNSKTFKKIKN